MSFVLIKDVTKRFGTVTAVDNISLTVNKGEIFGLVGSDGAGKSTLLRMAATMIPPDSGQISIKGLDVVNNRMEVKGIMGYMPQRFGLYHDLTVNENMEFFMDIFGIFGEERKRRLERYLGFSNLMPFLDRLAGKLSGGMKQKLGLACVLVHEPELLILDEPTNGVDPVSRMEFWDILFSMKEQGMTIMVSTSYLDEGEKCDRIALMHKARKLEIDTPVNIERGFPDLEEAVIERIKDVEILK
ncbi:MAG: ABC transporter ATP-binding protein [Desulfatiglans sp.]|jgi:ABC-2 type transport system ATP-binding protein|nr:ABC transporter ATP-binding protein [Desulfatiglans sp.]